MAWKDVLHVDSKRTTVRLSLADALLDQGDTAGARAHYLTVLQTEKDSPEALNGIGQIHLMESKLPQAEAAFRGAIAADSKYVPAYNNLAITLERANRKKEAIAALEKAARLAPNDADVKRNLRRLKGS